VPGIAHTHTRQVLLLDGCVQPALAPVINDATVRVLDRLGIQALRDSRHRCCGAIHQHTGDPDQARNIMRRNIDAWWPFVERGIEAIFLTASGCGLMVRDYAEQLRDDRDYAEKSQRVSELARDLSEIVQAEPVEGLPGTVHPATRVAFHTPCTLQHGLGLSGVVETILQRAGYQVCRVSDSHLCCGSAGTYSIQQPELSTRLRDNRLTALATDRPDVIATANIGCLLQLQSGSSTTILHWIQLLDAPTL
jgi:glycolate oxidase iron-sulfur subunit